MNPSQPVRAAIITSNRRLRRQVTRAVASLGWEVVTASFTRPELTRVLDQGIALYIVDADDDIAETRWLLERMNTDHPESSALLLSFEVENSLLVEVLSADGLNNLVARQAGMSTSPDAIDEPELMVTCQKLVQGDIFGLDKYLTTWGMKLHRRQVASTAEKDQAILGLEEFLHLIDCYGRIVAPISMVAEELMMNALFNAPRDAQGRSKYADVDRREQLQLEPSEACTFSYGCDGRNVGLSVADPFGALDREAIVAYLKKCFLGEPGRIRQNGGGAGLGLYMVFNSITQLSFNIDIGKRTEVIALFYVREGVRAFKNSCRSLHIFLKR